MLEGSGTSRYVSGPAGPAGESAYQAWLDAGNSGTKDKFVASLKGRDGRDGTAGAGAFVNRSAAVSIPDWRAVYIDDQGAFRLADARDANLFGRVIGIVAHGGAAGDNLVAQSLGELAGPAAGFLFGTSLIVGADGILTPNLDPAAAWRQTVATVAADGRIVVALGEASLIETGDVLLSSDGVAVPSTEAQVRDGEGDGYVRPTALRPVLDKIRTDIFTRAPRPEDPKYGIVADALVAPDGTLVQGTDQTAGINAYLADCRDASARPILPRGANGLGYLVLGTLTAYDEGDYLGEIIAPNYATSNPVVSVLPNPADLLTGTVTDVRGWSNLFRGTGRIRGMGFNRATFAATISVAKPAVVTAPGHGVATNDPVVFATTGTLPSPLVVGTTYFAIRYSADTFGLSLTPYGGAIETKTAGSGTHLVTAKTSLKGCYVTVTTTDEALIGRAGGGGDRIIKQGQGLYINNDDGRTPHPLYADWHVNGGADNVDRTATAAVSKRAILNRRTHGLAVNTAIRLRTKASGGAPGVLPAPLNASDVYYVVNPNFAGANLSNFAIATTAGGTPIEITTAGSGAHSYVLIADDPTVAPEYAVSITAPAIFTSAGHGIVEGTPVRVTTAGVLPSPIVSNDTYFAVLVTPNSFALTAGGAFGAGITATTAGSGDITVTASPSYSWPWTDAATTVVAQRVRQPISIGGLRITYYRPSADSGLPSGSRTDVALVTRCNTSLHYQHVRNLSGVPIAQGIHIENCCFVSLYDSSVAGLLAAGTNYSVALGATCDVDIYSTNITECRRSLDQHRCVNTTIWGGCWPDAIGAHWQSGTKIIGATIAGPISAIYMSGGDVTVLGCRVHCVYSGTATAVFDLRDDVYSFPGVLHIGGGTSITIDVTGAGANQPFLFDLEGPRTTYDTFKVAEMPSSITMDQSVVVKVVGSNADTKLNLLRYSKNFDAGMRQPILGSKNIYIGPTVDFDSENDGSPRCVLFYTNAPQNIGGACIITVENVPSLDVLIVAGSDATKKTGRVDLYVRNVPGKIKIDARGGAIHYGVIEGYSVEEVNRRSTYQDDEYVRIIDRVTGGRTNGTDRRAGVNGQTVAFVRDKDQTLVTGSGTLAALTLQLPSTGIEGRTATFIVQPAVTNATYDGNGKAVAGSPPAGLPAGSWVEFKLIDTTGSGNLVWQYRP